MNIQESADNKGGSQNMNDIHTIKMKSVMKKLNKPEILSNH